MVELEKDCISAKKNHPAVPVQGIYYFIKEGL